MRTAIKIIALSIIFGAISGSIATYFVSGALGAREKTQDELIKDFYLIENAVYISPHSLRGKIDKGTNDFILVDLRSNEEYQREHVVGAINIPAYKSQTTSAYDEVDRIVGEFAKLPENKEIIVYCYSMPCMTGRKIGKMLVDHGIYVKHLGIGWNEWRHFWTLWNHEYEWNTTDVMKYIASGDTPGVFNGTANSSACPISGEFSC